MWVRAIRFLAVLLTGLALIPARAHLFELPNKINLSRDAYLAVQGIYAGWVWFGIVYLAALVFNAVRAIRLPRQHPTFHCAMIAALCIAIFFAIFFTWTFPAKQATANWTSMPDDWSRLRRLWEYSHVANAVVMLIALCSMTLSVITARRY